MDAVFIGRGNALVRYRELLAPAGVCSGGGKGCLVTRWRSDLTAAFGTFASFTQDSKYSCETPDLSALANTRHEVFHQR